MKLVQRLLVVLATALLVSCGGSGCDAGSSPLTGSNGCSSSGGGGTTTAQTIDVLASAVQVGTGGETVDVSAIVKGAGNVSLGNTAITFASDTGTLTGASTTTDASGVAGVTLSAGADKTNRVITVTARSGNAVGTIQITVAGTALTFSGATTVPLGTVTTLAIKATDSKGAAIANLPVTVASSLSNGLSATTVTTDAMGTASVSYTATNSGNDKVTFSGAGTSISTNIQISGENFVFTSPAANALIPVGTSATVSVRYLSGNAPQAGRTVNFAATAGTVTPASAVTDASGVATVSVSSATASPATLQATLTGATTAQATLPVEFVALTPARLVLQVTPSAIGPNLSGSTTSQARLLATVTDVNGNPVKGATVNFNRVVDPSGGNLSQASAVTDSSGQASVQYIAGGLTTASNGVQLRATVASATSVFGDATLTVNQSALFIALGTGNVISNLDPQTYKKDWVVYVTDANGIAVSNITLTVKVLPNFYGKGHLVYQNGFWQRVEGTTAVNCANEDLNYNGVLDAGEDTNHNGTLEPGNVISVSPGTVTTDSNGRATVSLIYAESYVPWVDVTLRVQAVVSGTESSKVASFRVIGLAADFSDATVPPAGVNSPFGTVLDCTSPN